MFSEKVKYIISLFLFFLLATQVNSQNTLDDQDKKTLEKSLNHKVGIIETMVLARSGNTDYQECICKTITSNISLNKYNMNSCEVFNCFGDV